MIQPLVLIPKVPGLLPPDQRPLSIAAVSIPLCFVLDTQQRMTWPTSGLFKVIFVARREEARPSCLGSACQKVALLVYRKLLRTVYKNRVVVRRGGEMAEEREGLKK